MTFGKVLDQNSELDQFDDFSMDNDIKDPIEKEQIGVQIDREVVRGYPGILGYSNISGFIL